MHTLNDCKYTTVLCPLKKTYQLYYDTPLNVSRICINFRNVKIGGNCILESVHNLFSLPDTRWHFLNQTSELKRPIKCSELKRPSSRAVTFTSTWLSNKPRDSWSISHPGHHVSTICRLFYKLGADISTVNTPEPFTRAT